MSLLDDESVEKKLPAISSGKAKQKSKNKLKSTSSTVPTQNSKASVDGLSIGATTPKITTARNPKKSKNISCHLPKHEASLRKNKMSTKTARKKKSTQRDRGAINHSKTPRLLHENDVLMKRFIIEGMLAGGGFGQVYLGTDKVTGQKYAIKAQTGKEHEKRIKLEILLYMRLRGKKHIPLIIAACPLPNQIGGALIMQLVGRSLADVRRQMPHKKFTPATLFRTMKQVLMAISFVHYAGFIHRDVKPPNCCIGAVDITRIYLLDFGLCRQYVDGTGMVRKARKEAPFRGTLRYASLSGHAKKEFGPCNDLVAFLYSTIELGHGRLPWSQHVDMEKIEKMKHDTKNSTLCEGLEELLPFADFVTKLEFNVIPDYDQLFKLFDRLQPDGINSETLYDWEIVPCELELKVKLDEGLISTPERIDKN